MKIQMIYRHIGGFFRARRMKEFWERFQMDSTTSVLDVGGYEAAWTVLPELPRLTLINIDENDYSQRPETTLVIGDGRALPFGDGSFDVLFSNSVIEHLGSWENQKLFADECRRVGKRYYVQTPNRWFFLETHLLTPFIHWLPKAVQVRLMRNFSVRGLMTRPGQEECRKLMDEIRLLDASEMQTLFPDAQIWRERFLFMTKSLIAARL